MGEETYGTPLLAAPAADINFMGDSFSRGKHRLLVWAWNVLQRYRG